MNIQFTIILPQCIFTHSLFLLWDLNGIFKNIYGLTKTIEDCGYMAEMLSLKSLSACRLSGFLLQPRVGARLTLSDSYCPLSQCALPLQLVRWTGDKWVGDWQSEASRVSVPCLACNRVHLISESKCASTETLNPIVLWFSMSLKISIFLLSQGKNCINFHS